MLLQIRNLLRQPLTMRCDISSLRTDYGVLIVSVISFHISSWKTDL